MPENSSSSEIVEPHLPCDKCGSSDALTLYSDGHTYCFSCETVGGTREAAIASPKVKSGKNLIPLEDLSLSALKTRKISQQSCSKYGYYIGKIATETVQVANYCNDDGLIVGQKIRDRHKNFRVRGDVHDRFFGQHLWNASRKLIITEGEIDCLTVYQVNKNYPCVSLPLGATSAKKTFKAQLDWLETFGEVIVMFDNDEPGRKALTDIEGLLSPSKMKIATLPMKDPNECLVHGKADEIVKAIYNAKPYKPDGIINGAELWDCLINEAEPECIDLPWRSLDINKMTRGIRKGEMTLITAGTGIGKSTIVREMAYDLGVNKDYKIGLMMLEDNKRRIVQYLMGLHASKRIHLMWDALGDEEKWQLFNETLGTQRFIIYDHFGSVDGDNLLKKIRYMAAAERCDFIVLDHISIAVSGLEGDNERKQIDVLMTQMRSLIEELGIGIIVVCHVRKTNDSSMSPESGGIIGLNDLRGSGTLKQIPDTIIAGERDQQADDEDNKNTVKLRVLKCRFTGETGIGGYLSFNRSTGRLEEILGEREVSDSDMPF